jgi:hypothetical protein
MCNKSAVFCKLKGDVSVIQICNHCCRHISQKHCFLCASIVVKLYQYVTVFIIRTIHNDLNLGPDTCNKWWSIEKCFL